LTENKPLQVEIGDVDIQWPSSVDDRWLEAQDAAKTYSGEPTHSTIAIIIPVIRFIGQLKKTLKAPVISKSVLRTYDEYFQAILRTYPEQYQHHADVYLEPFCLNAIIPLQLARFQLYRHNLNTHASPQERTEALDRCVSVALETTRYFSRSMRAPTPSTNSPGHATQSWRDLLLASMDNTTCRHIWRCTLVLCFRGEYNAALTCLRVARTIDDARKLNIACGRNLSFFLEKLVERLHGDTLTQRELEMDFELLAYASGDLQGDIDNAFVWQGSEPSHPHSAALSPNDPTVPSQPFADEDLPASALLTEKEMKDWGGWEHVERQIGVLIEEQQKQMQRQHIQLSPSHQQQQQQQPPPPPPLYHRPAHNEQKRVHLAPPEAAPNPSGSSTPSAGASRISIANII
jgi:hypothetical protein